jgi:hypothetical protein
MSMCKIKHQKISPSNLQSTLDNPRRQKYFNINDNVKMTLLFLWKSLANLTWGILLPYSTLG